MEVDLSNRTVVVTGASRGLGRAISAHLSAQGASLGLIARSQPELENVQSELVTKSIAISSDVTNEIQMQAAFERIKHELGSVDSVIINAGALLGARLAKFMPIDKWRQVVELNLTGAFITAHAAYKHLCQSHSGRIIFITSCAVRFPTRGMCDYAAAKSGVDGLARALAIEWAEEGIRVNSVAPGFIDEGGTRDVDEKNKVRMIGRTVVGRPGYAHDLFGVVSLLAGNNSEYITGQTFSIDGGYGLN